MKATSGTESRYGADHGSRRSMRRLVGSIVCAGAMAAPAHAQATVSFLPSVIRTHLFGGPRVQSIGGPPHRLPSTSDLELIFVAATKTRVQRLSVFGSVQWLPNAGAQRNPYTLYTANELGGRIRANAPTASLGVSYGFLVPKQTSGWFDLSGIVADLFSQAARPDDRSSYTHKLDLELFTHLHVFSRLPEQTYVHHVSLFALLDYVATGLPRAGDEVPVNRFFLTAARPTSLIAGLALPLVLPKT